MPVLHKNALIAVTMGDPAGIGGEVALKALASCSRRSSTSYCLLGDHGYLVRSAKKFGVRLPLVQIKVPGDARRAKGKVGILDLGGAGTAPWGKVSASCGKAAVRYISEGARLALSKEVDALVTAPICKESIHKAGCPFPGHTELLAHLSRTKIFAMMMVGGPFKIVLQSIHVPLEGSIGEITRAAVLEKLGLTHGSLRKWFGIRDPRIAVAGLNPHAGENGAFGSEEIRILEPVVRRAQKKGWRVTGPHPPDTLFYWASKGKYDAVLCMYHDQGLIPFKLLVFETGVNLTLGLPFVRTSPDHGTAFDIAGKGKADPSSMIAAIQLAEQLS